jgi:hypothetical protein
MRPGPPEKPEKAGSMQQIALIFACLVIGVASQGGTG